MREKSRWWGVERSSPELGEAGKVKDDRVAAGTVSLATGAGDDDSGIQKTNTEASIIIMTRVNAATRSGKKRWVKSGCRAGRFRL
jgi:hypothetical protein